MSEVSKTLQAAPLGWKVTFFVCLSITIGMMITSFFMPPEGVIDPSVLMGTAELFAFPTLYTAYECIQKGIAARYHINVGGVQIGLETNKDEKKDGESKV